MSSIVLWCIYLLGLWSQCCSFSDRGLGLGPALHEYSMLVNKGKESVVCPSSDPHEDSYPIGNSTTPGLRYYIATKAKEKGYWGATIGEDYVRASSAWNASLQDMAIEAVVGTTIHTISPTMLRNFRSLARRLRASLAHKTSSTELNVGFFGGSFTKGTGCANTKSKKTCDNAWTHQVLGWLRYNYPAVKVNPHWGVQGSTSVHHGYAIFRQLVYNFLTKHPARHPFSPYQSRAAKGGAGAVGRVNDIHNHYHSPPPMGLQPVMDLAIFDFACNDFGLDHMSLSLTQETIIRLAYKLNIPIIFLSTCVGRHPKEALSKYRRVFERYRVPLLAYSAAAQSTLDLHVHPEWLSGTRSDKFSPPALWPGGFMDDPHPRCPAHRYVFEMITTYLDYLADEGRGSVGRPAWDVTDFYDKLKSVVASTASNHSRDHEMIVQRERDRGNWGGIGSGEKVAKISVVPKLFDLDVADLESFDEELVTADPMILIFLQHTLFGAPIDEFNDYSDYDATQECFPSTHEYSSLPLDREETTLMTAAEAYRTFTPFKPDEFKHHGWIFASDQHGKPPGWLAPFEPLIDAGKSTAPLRGPPGTLKRLRKDPSDSPSPYNISVLSFHIAIPQGRVSISYLETYRDAGKLELYVSNIPNEYGSNGGIYGRDPRPYKIYKPSSGFVSFSTFIDTYNETLKHSQISTKTVAFSAHGQFLLHIRHVPLEEGELLRRGGDKVKILGVTSC